MNSYQRALEERKKQHLLRTLPLLPEGIDFYSNDYLGLAENADLTSMIEKSQKKSPMQNGATGSRLLSGNSEYIEDIEQKVAAFHNTESALIYASGYTANLGLISSLATRETTLFCDELLHASLIDGARLGHAKRVKFSHNELSNLNTKLNRQSGQKVVIVESLYSMDGDVCPFTEFVDICEKNDALLIVDEAHSMGIYGNGTGLVQELGLEQKVLARIMTYGKAPGIHGAAVVGPEWLRNYQINFSRSMIFSTAPASHHFAAIDALYKFLPGLSSQRQSLNSIISYFVSKRKDDKGNWLDSSTQIQSLIVPGNKQVIDKAEMLRAEGINALPIRKPSVAEGSERIRFCLHAFNTKKEIDKLFEVLRDE